MRYLRLLCLALLASVVAAVAARAGDPDTPPSGPAKTPATLAGAETHVFRPASTAEAEPVRLHVYKPKDWQASDRRPALVWFYGGGFVRGTPEQAAAWARRAARDGMVGVAVDYRTKERWSTDATACVADARLAVRWMQERATEFGVDPACFVVGGGSAGGHLALWTAITATPAGLDPAEAPLAKPIALLLNCPAADTSRTSGLRGDRFDGRYDDFSPLHRLDPQMPPVLLIHGDADTTVPYAHAVALHAALTAAGNTCEFITVPGGTHKFTSDPEWRQKVPELQRAFLTRHGILPVTPR